MRGHLLCVFDLNALHPQSLTFGMLRLAAGVGPLVARADFALGFNSAGAWSSVNHCHFQGYWMDGISVHAGLGSRDQFPVVLQPRDVLFCAAVDESQVAVSRLVHWPMRCLVIEQFESDVEGSTPTTDSGAVLRVTWQLIHILQTQGIPHNLLLVWRPRLQVIVFPRQPQQENAMGRFTANDSGQQLRFAVAEVSGLVVTGGPSMFSELTESIYADIMRHELSLDEVRDAVGVHDYSFGGNLWLTHSLCHFSGVVFRACGSVSRSALISARIALCPIRACQSSET
jgi:hypothetical protein